MATALITGIAGQDGSYLAEFLLANGYRVFGVVRSDDDSATPRLRNTRQRIEVVEADLLSQHACCELIGRVRPDEVYNLAARASSSLLHEQPLLTIEANTVSVVHLLEAIRMSDCDIRFCQASSSEMFGNIDVCPQNESTPFHPRNPYGIAKLCAHWFTVNYRRTHGLFACSSILYNHESPRRGEEFVTRRVSRAVAAIARGTLDRLVLGDLEARRDWGYAGDFVRGMWQMLQAPTADDYVLATGESHSVRDLCEIAFSHVGLDYREYVETSEAAVRRADSGMLVGDATKARDVLGWTPTVSFRDLVTMMVDADLKLIDNGANL